MFLNNVNTVVKHLHIFSYNQNIVHVLKKNNICY